MIFRSVPCRTSFLRTTMNGSRYYLKGKTELLFITFAAPSITWSFFELKLKVRAATIKCGSTRNEARHCIFLDSVQRRREIDAEFKITEYIIKKITLIFYVLWKRLIWNKYSKTSFIGTLIYRDLATSFIVTFCFSSSHHSLLIVTWSGVRWKRGGTPTMRLKVVVGSPSKSW